MLHDDVGVGVPIKPPSVTLHAAHTPLAQPPPRIPWHGVAGREGRGGAIRRTYRSVIVVNHTVVNEHTSHTSHGDCDI